MTTTVDSIRALAPDDASFKAARGLCVLRQWPSLGRNADAMWGECQGSGSKPYQTQVDLRAATPSFKCSCPSRKFPCKHGLALLLLGVEQAAAFGGDTAPPWVEEWLNARAERSEKKVAKASAPAAEPDLQARAKREQKRHQRIAEAAIELQRWLVDVLDRGLGSLNASQRGAVESMAARMVDAQAPGLAARLRDLAQTIGNGEHWIARALAQMGLLQLACDGIARRDALSSDLRAELDAVLGWSVDKAELLSSTAGLIDHWSVVGQRISELDNRLSERRVWLYGARSARFAYLLDYRFAAAAFERQYIIGSAFVGALHLHPGFAGLRATLGEIESVTAAQWPTCSLADGLDAVARRAAQSPWLWWQPLWLPNCLLAREGDSWTVFVERRSWRLSISEQSAYELLACSGGAPEHLFAEWRGTELAPLCAVDPSVGPIWQRTADA